MMMESDTSVLWYVLFAAAAATDMCAIRSCYCCYVPCAATRCWAPHLLLLPCAPAIAAMCCCGAAGRPTWMETAYTATMARK